MGERWRIEQVVALAPDAASVTAGRRLAQAGTWSATGHRDADGEAPGALWGLCQGSGKNPYQTIVDLSGPAFECSCPSRKFPCKHALGLMLLWSTGQVPDAPAAEFARTWLDARAERTAAPATPQPADPEAAAAAAAARARQRAERVTGGLADLDRWLQDQVRSGLASSERAGYAHFEQVAARMVDAQAPGAAAWLRRLPGVVFSGDGWPGRLLAEYALMALLVRAHERLAELPAPLAATVRQRVGYPVAKEAVLATPPVADRWSVLGLRDSGEERLTARRVWLVGHRTHRTALVLSFTPSGAAPDSSLAPGTSLDADLHFYPGAAPLRALVGARHGTPDVAMPVTGLGIDEALRQVAAALAADPWTTSWPVLLRGVTVGPVTTTSADGARRLVWRVSDGTATLPLAPEAGDPWVLVAIAGGHPIDLLADWTPDGLVPLSVLEPDPAAPGPLPPSPLVRTL